MHSETSLFAQFIHSILSLLPPGGAYHLSTPESAEVGSSVGRIKANDADAGVNAEMWYSILDGDGQDMFNIVTDATSQEGVITVKKVNGSCFKHAVNSYP